MRISIDAHTLGLRKTGNETYIRNLINGLEKSLEKGFLEKLEPGITCDVYVTSSGYSAVPRSYSQIAVSRNPFRRLGWDLPRAMQRRAPDILAPDILHVQYTAPLWTRVPVVVTVHDVSFLEHPEYFHPLRAAQIRRTVARTVATAACVITPSEFSRRAVLRHYALDPAKVVTIPNGVSGDFRPLDRNVSRLWIAHKFGIRAPFVLAVGNLEARKNPLGLLRAFEKLVHQRPGLPHHLVFAGQDGWRGEEVRRAAALSAIAERVHFAGYVDDGDLVELYSACELFVFPSFYEGFGLPILEAMASGRAVACSNTTSMPEVTGAAAWYFNPYSQREMVTAMASLLEDEPARRRLERLGVERARSFTWVRTSSMTLDVYRAGTRGTQSGSRLGKQHADRALFAAPTR